MSSEPQVHVPKQLIFTYSAAAKVAELIMEEDNPNLKLRAFISGGGCSGFQYGFTFDEEVEAGDTVIEKTVTLKDDDDDEGGGDGEQTVQLLIDPMSFQYLVGAEIDYKDDIEGARFVIKNPNAKTTCGCGSSFSV